MISYIGKHGLKLRLLSIISKITLNSNVKTKRPDRTDPSVLKWLAFLKTQENEVLLSQRLGFSSISKAEYELSALIYECSKGNLPRQNASGKAKINLIMELLGWSLSAAVSVDDFEEVAQKIQCLRPIVLIPANKKKLARAMEAKLKQFASDNLPSIQVVSILSTIFIEAQFTNTKEGIHFVKRLLVARKEAEAAFFLETQMSLNSLGPGYYNLTILFKDSNLRRRLQEGHFDRLQKISANDDEALSLFSKQLMQAGRLHDAGEALSRAEDAENEKILMVKANLLFWEDKYKEAENAALRALENSEVLSEKEQSSLYLILAQSRIGLGDSRGALQALHLRENYCPKANTVEATTIFANLQLGNYEEAFNAYWDSPGVIALKEISANVIAKNTFMASDGRLKKTSQNCVVICSMGVGDEVRFARLIPQIKELFDKLTVLCDNRLVNIFSRNFPGVTFHGVDQNLPVSNVPSALNRCVDKICFPLLTQADYVADFKQFAALFVKTADDIPFKGCHLQLMQEDVSRWREWIAENTKKPVIGLFWRSSLPSHAAKHKQSELKDWLCRLSGLDVRIVPLQYDLTEEEDLMLSQDNRTLRTPDNLDLKNDLDNVFALLKALPIVISVPGTTQHMAGAVGARVLCPCHPYEASWRRVRGRKHDLWAPSVEVISGEPERGLSKSMDLTIEKLTQWLDQEKKRHLFDV